MARREFNRTFFFGGGLFNADQICHSVSHITTRLLSSHSTSILAARTSGSVALTDEDHCVCVCVWGGGGG
jgi:hypothetical protein